MTDKNLKFEAYKLHAELAERLSSQREDVNKLHSGVVAGIITGAVILQRLSPSNELVWVLPVLGILVSASWIMSILSMTEKLKAKNVALTTLEKQCIPFHFLTVESNKFQYKWLRRNNTALVLPGFFAALCVTLLIIGVFQIWPEETPTNTTSLGMRG